MQVSGIIKLINDTQTFESGFRKRDLVVTTQEQYQQHILVEFTQDRCDVLNNFQVGQHVTISINLRGREWTNSEGVTRYFNSIQGWRIELFEQVSTPPSTQMQQPNSMSGNLPPAGFTPQNTVPQTPVVTPKTSTDNNPQEEDDLPF